MAWSTIISIIIYIIFQEALFTTAICHKRMCQWPEALEKADKVLALNSKFVRAILLKAEALFNLCRFEHSLVLFHRGKVSNITIPLSEREFNVVIGFK